MLLQGDLQSMFDALYYMGVINPVLEMDWAQALEEMPHYQKNIQQVVSVVNTNQGNVDALMKALVNFDEKTLSYLAMEVAREFADYHTCEIIH